MQAPLSRSDIQEFLNLVGAPSLDAYLGTFGPTLPAALEARLAWAETTGRTTAESVFLLDHQRDLRKLAEEGPRWLERLVEDERRVRAEDLAKRPVLTSPPAPRRPSPEREGEGRPIAPDESAEDAGYLTLMEFLTVPPPPTRHDVALKLGDKDTPIRAPRLDPSQVSADLPSPRLAADPPRLAAFTTPDGRTIEPPPTRPHGEEPRRSATLPLLAGVLGAAALVLAWLVLR